MEFYPHQHSLCASRPSEGLLGLAPRWASVDGKPSVVPEMVQPVAGNVSCPSQLDHVGTDAASAPDPGGSACLAFQKGIWNAAAARCCLYQRSIERRHRVAAAPAGPRNGPCVPAAPPLILETDAKSSKIPCCRWWARAWAARG